MSLKSLNKILINKKERKEECLNKNMHNLRKDEERMN